MQGNVPNPVFLLERWFWQRNIREALVRTVLSWQICIIFLSLVTGGASIPFWDGGRWLLWFGCGGMISAWNFYALARFVQNMIPKGWSVSSLVLLLVNVNVRMILSGGILFAAFVWGNAPLSALFLGIATILVCITVVGLKKTLKKPD